MNSKWRTTQANFHFSSRLDRSKFTILNVTSSFHFHLRYFCVCSEQIYCIYFCLINQEKLLTHFVIVLSIDIMFTSFVFSFTCCVTKFIIVGSYNKQFPCHTLFFGIVIAKNIFFLQIHLLWLMLTMARFT